MKRERGEGKRERWREIREIKRKIICEIVVFFTFLNCPMILMCK